MEDFFYGCHKVQALDVSRFDTSNVKNMSWMFYSCDTLPGLNLSRFNTSKVTGMNYMFAGCKNITALDLSNFDMSQVKDMQGMFSKCEKLKTVIMHSTTNPGALTGHMFGGCKDIRIMNLIIKNKKIPKKGKT